MAESKKRRMGRMLAGIVLGAGILSGCAAQKKNAEPLRRSEFLLNTFVTITLYDKDEEKLLEEAVKLCRDYEEKLSKTVEGSEIYQINHREAGVKAMEVSDETAEMIEKGLYFSSLSDGAFDLTIEPLSSLWNFTGEVKEVPDARAIREAAERVDYRKLSVEGNQVSFLDDQVNIKGIFKRSGRGKRFN